MQQHKTLAIVLLLIIRLNNINKLIQFPPKNIHVIIQLLPNS